MIINNNRLGLVHDRQRQDTAYYKDSYWYDLKNPTDIVGSIANSGKFPFQAFRPWAASWPHAFIPNPADILHNVFGGHL